MEKLTHSKLQTLLNEDTAPCITLFVPLGQIDTEEPNKGVYKNLITNAESLLEKHHSKTEIQNLMKNLKNFDFRLLEDTHDKTLVIFKSKSTEGYWTHPKALPGLCVVSDSFHIKPIIEYFLPAQEFFVLSLASDHATLFYGTNRVFEPIHTFEIDYERTHEQLKVLPEKGYRIFQALEKFLLSSGYKLKDFFTEPLRRKLYDQVDTNIRRFIQGKNIPLILAGSTSDKARYRSLNTCYQLKRGSINFTLSPIDKDMMSYAHSAAKLIAATHYENLKKKEIAKISHAEKAGNLAVGVDQVFKALCNNSVETLFVNRSEVIWGIANWNQGYFTVHTHQLNHRDDDLIDDFMEKSLHLGTKIITVDKDPRFFETPIVAILKNKTTINREYTYAEKIREKRLSLRGSNL